MVITKLLPIMLMSFLFAGELEVDGDLKVTGTIQASTIDSLNQEIAALYTLIAQLQAQLLLLQQQLGLADCNGIIGGSAVEDECGVCDSDPANDCILNYALEFDGNNDVVTLFDDSQLDGIDHSTGITMSCWIKIYNQESLVSIIRNDGEFNLMIQNRKLCAEQFHDGNYYQKFSETQLQEHLWYHVMSIWDGTGFDLYIDGIPQTEGSEDSHADPNWTSTLSLGKSLHHHQPFHGIIDDVLIINNKVTQEGVMLLYENNLQSFNNIYNVLVHYNFNEGIGDTLNDLSGNENHAYINGANWVGRE